MRISNRAISVLTFSFLQKPFAFQAIDVPKTLPQSQISIDKHHNLLESMVTTHSNLWKNLQNYNKASKEVKEVFSIPSEKACANIALGLSGWTAVTFDNDYIPVLMEMAQQIKKFCLNSKNENLHDLINKTMLVISSKKEFLEVFKILAKSKYPIFSESLTIDYAGTDVSLDKDNVIYSIAHLSNASFKKLLNHPENNFLINPLAKFIQNFIFTNMSYDLQSTSLEIVKQMQDFKVKTDIIIEIKEKKLRDEISSSVNVSEEDAHKFHEWSQVIWYGIALLGMGLSVFIRFYNVSIMLHQLSLISDIKLLKKTCFFLTLHAFLLLDKKFGVGLSDLKELYFARLGNKNGSSFVWLASHSLLVLFLAHFSKRHVQNIKAVKKSTKSLQDKIAHSKHNKNESFLLKRSKTRNRISEIDSSSENDTARSNAYVSSHSRTNYVDADAYLRKRVNNKKSIYNPASDFERTPPNSFTESMERVSSKVVKHEINDNSMLSLHWSAMLPSGETFDIRIYEQKEAQNNLKWEVEFGAERLIILFENHAKKEFLSEKEGNKSEAWAKSWDEYLYQKLPEILVNQKNPLIPDRAEWNCLKKFFGDTKENIIEYKPKHHASIKNLRLKGVVSKEENVVICTFDSVENKDS